MENYNLSQGALETIMRGGDYTQQPIIQVLGCKKVAAGSSDKQRYRVLLSDGKHTDSFAMLTTKTNENFGPAGVSQFSVIRVERFVTSVVNNASGKADQRVLLILDLEIIVPGEEIGRKIGSPQPLNYDMENYNLSQGALEVIFFNALHLNDVSDKDDQRVQIIVPGEEIGKKIGSPEPLNCDMENYNLSQGALKIIMRGGDYTQPIIQVLGSKKVAAESLDKQRYRVLLSDGKNTVSFAMLTTQTNEKFGPAGVSQFSVIRVERFVTSVVNNGPGEEDQRVLLVLDLEIIVPGEEIGRKIGSPEPLNCDIENYNLSQGALQTIMRGGDYTQPIIQVLRCEKVAGGSLDKQRYRVLLSDGKHTVSFAMLSTQNEKFGAAGVPPFSVIRVERFVTVVNNASKDQRVLLVLDFKIIVPGEEIGKKIGSPKPFSTTSMAATKRSNQNISYQWHYRSR